ncbi:MAG TPA: hypothetical protein VII78_19215 [Myxococcota bacterium]
MALAPHTRRLGPALLAALVLCVSLASAAHAHPAAARHAAAFAAEAQHEAQLAGSDLDCALCAAGSRLAHGAVAVPAALFDVALRRFHTPRAGDIAPLRVDLSRTEARAPPRLG